MKWNNFEITSTRDNSIWTRGLRSTTWYKETHPQILVICKMMLKVMRNRSMSESDKTSKIDALVKQYSQFVLQDRNFSNENKTDTTTHDPLIKSVVSSLISFFKDCDFTPSLRFINTLAVQSHKSIERAKDYTLNYFEVSDNANKEIAQGKCTSAEFEKILNDISSISLTKTINNRFKLYYGAPGTGKTYTAMKEAENRVINCNASMLPQDLIEDFVFKDGKPEFKLSALSEAMENGKPVVLDEINLLPFESIRFLQTLLDDKSEFIYKGHTIHINPGFMIIGTMNLSINGQIYGLPEPLVDRAFEIKKFNLSEENYDLAF